MARKAAPTGDIVKLKVTLAGLRPPVWRRLLIPADMTLGELHHVIQSAMGWEGGHLHDFDVGFARYGDPDNTDDVDDEAEVALGTLMRAGATRFRYTYDFGDDWVHQIVAEGMVPRTEGQRYPACIGGKRACPPEDSGGPYGLAQLMAVRADPSHPDHAEMAEWLEEDYDPEAFSVAEADARIDARFNGRTARR